MIGRSMHDELEMQLKELPRTHEGIGLSRDEAQKLIAEYKQALRENHGTANAN